MAATPRAREFVLGEKQRAIQGQVDAICQAYWEADDDAVIVPAIRARLEAAFGITIHLNDQQFLELLGAAPAEPIATLVAKKLLDAAPPTTKPAWSEPWGRGFPQIAIEQEQAQAAS